MGNRGKLNGLALAFPRLRVYHATIRGSSRRRSFSHHRDMASKKKPSPRAMTPPVTAERAARLYNLLRLLGKKPLTRDRLAAALDLGVRGFYRDLEALPDREPQPGGRV